MTVRDDRGRPMCQRCGAVIPPRRGGYTWCESCAVEVRRERQAIYQRDYDHRQRARRNPS